MANRFWVGGNGNWSSTSHWSASSGGASGASVPGVSDDAFFDTNSFSADNQVVTVDGDFFTPSKCKSFDSSAVTRPIHFAYPNAYGIQINGTSLKDGANITYDAGNGFILLGNPANGAINMLSADGGLAIDVVQGVWKLQHSLYCGLFEVADSSDISHPPTFDFNGFNMTASEFVAWGSYYGGSCIINCSTAATLFIINSTYITGIEHAEFKYGTTANVSNLDLNETLTDDAGGIYSEVSLTFHDVTLTNAPTTLHNITGFTCHNLTIGNGSKWYIAADAPNPQGRVITVTNQFTASGLCTGGGILIHSDTPGTQSTISAALATVANVDFKDMIGAGAASPFNDLDGTDSGNNSGITFTPLDRYWVGNAGNWDDSAHWATSSGGAGGSCPPNTTQNVFFDSNSFTIGAQTVSIRSGHTNQCKNINTTGVLHTPTLHFSGSGAELDLYGDVTITSGIGAVTPNDTNNPQSTFIKLMSTSSQNVSISPSANYGAGLIIGANGTFDLTANSAVSAFGVTNTLLTPTFNANNHTFTLNWMEWLAGTLNMDSATFSFINGMPNSEIHIKFKANGPSISPGTSTIQINGNGELFTPGYPDLADITLGNISIIGTNGSNTNLFSIHAESGALTVNNLTISPDCTVKFYSNYPGLTVNGTFTANGTSGHLIFLSNYFSFQPWTLICDTVSVSFVHVTYGTAQGSTLPFDATNGGEDGQNNTNWLFAPRYWVGGTGNWDDTAHWSASSGGAGGATAPGTCTNVFFDASSFSTTGQVVTTRYITSYPLNQARKVDWSAALHNPTWTFDSSVGFGGANLDMAADLLLAPSMSVTSNDPSHNYPSIRILAQRDSTYHIDTHGIAIPVEMDFRYLGSFVLDSDFSCFGVRLQNSGSSSLGTALSLTTNDFNVTTGFFQMDTSNPTYPCELDAGDSIFTMGPTRSYADQGFGTYDRDCVISFTSGFTLNYTYAAAALFSYFDPDLFLNSQAVNAVNFLGVSDAAHPYVLESDDFSGNITIESISALPGAGLNFFGSPDDPTVGNFNITQFHLHGEDGNLIHMFQDPGGPSYQFCITSNDVDVSFIDVQSCIANGLSLPYLDTGGLDSGFNVNWSFPPAPPPHPGAAWLEWFYLRNEYYPIGNAYAPDNSIFATTDDLQFFVLLMDNSYTMTKNTYYGFEPRNIITSFNLTPNFAIYKKIKNCIEDVFNTYNGVDFAIQVNINSDTNIMYRVFDVYYPKQGIDNTALNFTYPGNIKKFDLPIDGKTMMNEAIMRGQGSGINQLVDIQRGYNSIFSYGARQDVEQMPDVDDENILTKDGQEYIRVRQNPMSLPSITLDGNKLPYLGSYNIGDQIRIQITNVPSPVNAVYRIEQIHVRISDDDQEEIDLTLSLA